MPSSLPRHSRVPTSSAAISSKRSCRMVAEWNEGFPSLGAGFRTGTAVTSRCAAGRTRPHVVAIDYGMKWNIPVI